MKTKKILIFEDNEQIRELLIKFINRRYPFVEILSYEDPSFCSLFDISSKRCSCLHGHICVDAIITDINMTSINGIDFIKDLQSIGCKGMNVLFVSGAIGHNEMDYISNNGFDYLHKPFLISDLYDKLDKILI